MSHERFKLSCGRVTPAEALNAAFDLETAIGEVANMRRKADQIPLEPITRLVQFVRDGVEDVLTKAPGSEGRTVLNPAAAWPFPAPRRDGWPRATGVSRMVDNSKALLVSFVREPTDDELRALHERLR